MCEIEECKRCNGSGEIAISAITGRFVAAGPVPDDAKGVAVQWCCDCQGTGYAAEDNDG